MNRFLTTYKTDYHQKHAQRPDPVGMFNEFKDPLSEGYKEYLQLSSNVDPPKYPRENADIYMDKVKETKPKVGTMHFSTPINNDVMSKQFIYNGRSVYQCDYCNLEKDNEYKEEIRKKNLFRLPLDWNLPLNTSKYVHRNPTDINPNAMKHERIKKIPNNLDPQHHIRDILKVTTGKTEYERKICEVKETKPKVGTMHFSTPINNDVMSKQFIYNGRSVYQCDYCNLEKDNEYKEEIRKKNLFRLPLDWNLPLNTSKYVHRNPTDINPNAMKHERIKKIPNNLDPQHHIRDILKVTTGKTEYERKICEVGELIMNDEFHGKPVLL
ncbi:hypothetical protein FQA39_LY06008 [Lamprigera yunnana]|nr:hypothetical protein FQA39_LY06008 [Lamprigera yunnana]